MLGAAGALADGVGSDGGGTMGCATLMVALPSFPSLVAEI
jgi:hypothetical protein